MDTVTDSVYGSYNPLYGSYYDYQTNLYLSVILWVIGLAIAGTAAWLIVKHYIMYHLKSAIKNRW